MSSPASDAPLEVANLCSNCRKVQFRDDIPQLHQSGSCLELNREELPEDRRGSYTGGFLPTEFALTDSYPDLPQLWRSSQNGCDFCRFLHEIVVSFASEELDINKSSEWTMFMGISYSWAMLYDHDIGEVPNGLDAMLITAEFVSNDFEEHEFTARAVCHVESACDSDPVSNLLHLKNRSNQEYGDADSVRWMKQTLETCMNSHEHEIFDRAYIPERLIDVRPQMPRLTLREDHELLHCASAPKYTALSYCWGSRIGQAMTTLATLSKRRVGITETKLPRVVRDAIQVTRALGVPFLWVDALCIIQDDPPDWARQCTEMHNIYGSAHATFCAANSPGCNEGFLGQTGRIIRIPFQSLRRPNADGSFLIQYKGLVNHFGGLDCGPLYFDTSLSRWANRGWVFQEKILSTRRLMFGRRDLHFLCSECHQRRGQNAVMHPYEEQIGKSEIDEEPKAIYERWEGVLSSYSSYNSLSFTNATDVLPALSGLAQLFHGRLKDAYYAGHWGRTLYRSLLWSQDGDHAHDGPLRPASFSRRRSVAFIVPSWSNVDKGDTMPNYMPSSVKTKWRDCRSAIHLLDAKAITTDPNPFGALKDCRLRLRSYTLDLSHQEVDVLGPRFSQLVRPLMVYGRCFGTLTFDCKPALHEYGNKCVSECEFGQFKLLLLTWCDYTVQEATPTNLNGGAQSSREHLSSEVESASKKEYDETEQGGIECGDEAILDQESKCCGGFGDQEDAGGYLQMNADEAPAASQNSSDDLQRQQDSMQRSEGKIALKAGDHVRKGFGLIVCPTGNDGEFYRVGMFDPDQTDARSPPNDIGGDIRELQSIARLETVELV